MAETSKTLVSRTGATFRRGVASQGAAWSQYGSLLGQFADKKIGAVDFGRRAIDLYIGAVGDAFSTGTDIASDAVKTGLDRFSGVRSKAESMIKAVEHEAVEHQAKASARPKRATPARRPTKTASTA